MVIFYQFALNFPNYRVKIFILGQNMFFPDKLISLSHLILTIIWLILLPYFLSRLLNLNFIVNFGLFAHLRFFWHNYLFITLYYTALRLCFVVLMCLWWFQEKLSQTYFENRWGRNCGLSEFYFGRICMQEVILLKGYSRRLLKVVFIEGIPCIYLFFFFFCLAMSWGMDPPL